MTDSHPHDHETFPVAPRVRDRAQIQGREAYDVLYQKSVDFSQAFWAEQAGRLDWFQNFRQVLDWDFKAAHVAWFEGGKLNASHNCVDRHAANDPNKPAIIWEADEPNQSQTITYGELKAQVGRFANVLQSKGIGKGDRIILYLPMVPELAVAMLACARIGAVHSVVFAGFSADSVADRIVDCGAKMVITANEGLRGGKKLALKATVDSALDLVAGKWNCPDLVSSVLVVKRTDKEIPMAEGRDSWYHEEAANQRATCPAVWVDSEDPLFILYTSGSTGKPKGLLHTTGGYLTYASYTHKYVFDYQDGDVYFCAADIGWITGHSYIVYGPLANGATTIMFESTPMYPDPGRYWDVVSRHKVNIFYTAPTAIRAIAAEGNQWVEKYDIDSLRVLGTVGEPINPEAWKWYHEVVGKEQCAIVDTWWQTETGGIMITPQPGVNPTKPGSATLPFYGVQPCLVDENGTEIEGNDVSGFLCIKFPWPGMARTVFGDHQRFFKTYFERFSGYYFTGDGARRDGDGYYWITGRVDDVINVSGHRLGTAEIESAINSHSDIAESAVVGYPHDIKGTGIFAYVILNKDAGEMSPDALTAAVRGAVEREIGKIARPDKILLAGGLPKTRSGKIMRRILRNIAKGEYEDMGNITTLADPSVVEDLISRHKNA